MKKIICSMLLLSACATDPVLSHRAGIRRQAESQLKFCARGIPLPGPGNRFRSNPWEQARCIKQSERYCESQGLEKSCGVDGVQAGWSLQ